MEWNDSEDDWFSNVEPPQMGFSWAAWNKPAEKAPVLPKKEKWPTPKPRTDLIFAKSGTPGNWPETHAGTAIEPAANFGAVMIAGAMLMPSAETAIATALGIDFGLGRMAGGGIMQKGLSWGIRGAKGPAGAFVLGMLPSKLADDTHYTDDQLRRLSHASTRVRFQFRLDPEGELS